MKRFKKPEGERLIYESYDRLLKEWGIAIEERDMETAYGMTHVIVAGNPENPPLLLFHGVGDNSAVMWIYNMRKLAEHFHVVAVDTMGGPGKSEPNEAYFKAFDLSVWIGDILRALGFDKTYIAGVSNGGYMASRFTALNQEKVHRIVCMASGITLNVFKMMTVFLPEALFPSEKSTASLLRKLTAPGSDAFSKNKELMQHWRYLLKYFNNRSMMPHKPAAFRDEELKVLQDKALFLIGEYDRLTHYPKSLGQLRDKGMRYSIVKHAGHGINHEQPELVNEEIVRFLLN